MKTLVLFFACYLSGVGLLLAQQTILENNAVGGRAAAIGNASATLHDAWALFNNIACIAKEDKMSFVGSFENRFGISSFNTFSLGWVNPIYKNKSTESAKKLGVLGIGIHRFGDNLFNVQRIGLGYAHEIEQVSLGLKVNYTQVSFQDLGSRGTFLFEFGGRVNLSSQIAFAAHVYNFNQGVLRSAFAPDERMPVVMKAGLSYKPIKAVAILIENEKNLIYPSNFKAGVEYQIVQNFYVRTGINTRPFTNHFGMGYQTPSLMFDYALVTNNPLGLVHQLSMQFKLK